MFGIRRTFIVPSEWALLYHVRGRMVADDAGTITNSDTFHISSQYRYLLVSVPLERVQIRDSRDVSLIINTLVYNDPREVTVFPTDENNIPMSEDLCLKSFQLFVSFIHFDHVCHYAIEAKYESGEMSRVQNVIIPIA